MIGKSDFLAQRDASSVVEHSAFNRLAPSSTLGRPIILEKGAVFSCSLL
jgi:hypothetical protein